MKLQITNLLIAASLIASPFIHSQEQGQKAILLENGAVSAEPIVLPQELTQKSGNNFEQLENFPFGRPTHPNFKNFRGATIADIDQDGTEDILFATFSKLYAINGDGALLWEKDLTGTATLPPTVADITGDGTMEVVQNTGGVPANGRVYLLDGATGADLPGWPLNFNNNWMINAPAVSDLDGDGIMEIVFCERITSGPSRVHVVTPDGTPYNANWPIDLPGTPAFTPSIGDVNNDGVMNVVISTSSGEMHVIDSDTGQPIAGFPSTATGVSYSYQSPILVDLDGDETLEIVGSNHGDNPAFFVMKSDGSYATGWPYSINEWTYSPPTVADVNDDGVYELFFGNRNTSGDGSTPLDVIYGFNYEGDLIPDFSVNKYGGTEGVMTIADINNDGVQEVIFPSVVLDNDGNGFIHAYSLDGSGEVDGFPLKPRGFTFINGAVLGDVDNDGLLDLTANSYTQTFGASIDSAFVNVYNLNVPYDPNTILSNGYKGSNQRDGLIIPEEPMSVSDFENQTINIQPNPSTGVVTLTVPAQLENATVQLFSLDGKQLFVEKNFSLNQSGQSFNFEKISSGIYLIVISNQSQTFTGKWVKK
ncbi:T9SS type A sorting domain-containing protein [uncultured Planktosalinus sp.]|uniref:T9SS type A sorting domain-containing protein n=1 Tax=uncultured Planktosalinus sp. TaxID=1810935 RepID=UPI0030D94F02